MQSLFLTTWRGVGPITASAMWVALGDGSAFKRGKSFAASLGMAPRQHSSGGRERLLGISKRGDPYLRIAKTRQRMVNRSDQRQKSPVWEPSACVEGKVP